MAHAELSADEQAALDERLIAQTLEGALENPSATLGGDVNERPLELGDKADDAVDYEDIDDDDLADEEDAPQEETQSRAIQDSADYTDETLIPQIDIPTEEAAGTLDDLFGDVPSSELDASIAKTNVGPPMSFDFEEDEVFGDPIGPVQDGTQPTFTVNELQPSPPSPTPAVLESSVPAVVMSEEELLQQRLFGQSRSAVGAMDYLPAPPENREELLQSLWPKFEPHAVPFFMDLLPPKKARFIGKLPFKAPKPLQTTKLTLELAPDTERSFRFSQGTRKRTHDMAEDAGLIAIEDPDAEADKSADEVDMESDYEHEEIAGISWSDLQVICADWDIPSTPVADTVELEPLNATGEDDLFGDSFEGAEDLERQTKRRRLDEVQSILKAQPLDLPSLEDPEKATTKIGKKVMLDLNDSKLLVDERAPNPRLAMNRHVSSQTGRKLTTKELTSRYNISNDEAYDKLKQNHQNKVRNTLDSLKVNHSMPAMRLQWPYYKTKLAKSEARAFHRPMAHFVKGEPITFQIPKHTKKKHLKGRETTDIFHKTNDLSLGDNSHALLLEYSEEYPTMLSNFGMGSRIVNYYRKKHQEDMERPKLDIGELVVLLPNDTSPLTQFGEIKTGETVPSIYNKLFKAPIYQQPSKPTDFLMIRNSTGTRGAAWYLREIEHVRVVGQQFPSSEVPPPGGRKVTNASKNRLRMISYRIIRRKKSRRLHVQEVTRHVADSNDLQNRQKMKDFMVFSKESKEWEMRPGEQIPDESVIRSMIAPEDVCLLESMQVGQQHLEDAGFGEMADNTNEDMDDTKESQSLEQQLAPWQTTKNFLMAASNKAMLQLHGEGDPSGRGEAFSFLRTSMKGGFKAVGESVEDKLDAKKLKELGGHSYNVQKQAESYRESIRRIWDAQKQSLISNIEHSDDEMDDLEDTDELDESTGARGVTPRSELQTPSVIRRPDDETMSQFSRFSSESHRGQVLRIRRKLPDNFGKYTEQEELVTDPRVIKQYIAVRRQRDAERIDIQNIRADDDKDLAAKKIAEELARLERNRDRRHAREEQRKRAAGDQGSPGSSVAGSGRNAGGGTQRKCANCGQIGHIKTNKKLCPLLNGTMKQEDGFGESAFSTAPVL